MCVVHVERWSGPNVSDVHVERWSGPDVFLTVGSPPSESQEGPRVGPVFVFT